MRVGNFSGGLASMNREIADFRSQTEWSRAHSSQLYTSSGDALDL